MIRINVKVGGEGEADGITVQAESIKQALQIAAGFFPSKELRVPFPLDPDAFFVRDDSAMGLIEPVVLDRRAR